MRDPSLSPSTVSRRAAVAGLTAAGLALATHSRTASAQDASPAAANYPTYRHLMIGSWQWINYPDTLMEHISHAIFTSTGGYVEAAEGGFLAPGVWRSTGERTAELVLNPGGAVAMDPVFEPGYVVEDACLTRRDPAFLRIMMEVDETGNRMTASGAFEQPDGNGGIIEQDPFHGYGIRLTLASDSAATPTT